MVRLATGQQMYVLDQQGRDAYKAHEKPRSERAKTAPSSTSSRRRSEAAFLKDTPLWFYILREAELNRAKLKGVGARIVAETLHRAMEGSQASIVRDPTWRPSGPNNTTFRMVDLLLFAFEARNVC